MSFYFYINAVFLYPSASKAVKWFDMGDDSLLYSKELLFFYIYVFQEGLDKTD